jgi:hypothetical protein
MRQSFHSPDEGLGSAVAILLGALGAFALTFGFIVFLMVKGDHYANPGMASYTPPAGTVLIPPISGKPLSADDLPVASSNQPRDEAHDALAAAAADTAAMVKPRRAPSLETTGQVGKERERVPAPAFVPKDRMGAAKN